MLFTEMHFYTGPIDSGKGSNWQVSRCARRDSEEMSNSSKARNHFSEIGVRNRLRRITRKLFPPPPPLLPPPSPPAPSRFFFETAFYHPEKNIPKREVEREEPSAALLLRSLDSPQLRSAVNQPFHRPAHTCRKGRR